MTNTKDLKGAGLRPTLARIRILEIFSVEANKHLTAEELHEQLMAEGHDMSLATVYRTLTQFEHAGILERHRCQDGGAVYELTDAEHHDHMVCLQCDKMIEFHDPVIEERKRKIAEEAGFELEDHVLYLYVHCPNPDCPNKAEGEG